MKTRFSGVNIFCFVLAKTILGYENPDYSNNNDIKMI